MSAIIYDGKVLFVNRGKGFATVQIPEIGVFYPEINIFSSRKFWKRLKEGDAVQVAFTPDQRRKHILSVF